MGVAGKFRPRVVGVIVVALTLLYTPTAYARDNAKPIAEEEAPARENLNSVNRELFKRLFIKRRKEHLEAVRNLQKMDNYERQYKMINVLAEKMFDVIESKKPLLENFTEADLRSVSFAVDAKNDVQDAISSVLENIALFGDVVLNLPDITQRILKTQPKWNSTIHWSFDFLNRTKELLDKSTLEMIELALQELNITGRSPNYFNPNRINKPSRKTKEPMITAAVAASRLYRKWSANKLPNSVCVVYSLSQEEEEEVGIRPRIEERERERWYYKQRRCRARANYSLTLSSCARYSGRIIITIVERGGLQYKFCVFFFFSFLQTTVSRYFSSSHEMARIGISALLIVALAIGCVSGQGSGNSQSSKKDEEFVCPEGQGNGNFADPATCRRFYQCVDGYPYLNRCPSGLHFDDISKFCTFKNEARCGPIATTPAPITEAPTDLAERCDTAKCILPYCFCSRDGTIIPGGLKPSDTPQMILLTFDGAVNHNNFDHYQKIFNSDRVNPNNCPLKGTFFISHEYCNYNMVQSLAHDGHEIATETISLQKGLEDKNYDEWVSEMIGMREILKHFSNISSSDVVGMRAPYLKPGRNTQYKVMEDFGYIYDSSIGVSPGKTPIWPYTLDYKIPHECKAGTCPTKSFPGVWEIPLNAHYVESYEGGHCPYLDQCVLHSHDAQEVFEWLQEDFSRSYDQNRAPYMMPFHTNWFQIKELEKGLHKFLDWATTLPDVYFVTATQALTWITDPKPIQSLTNYEGWECKKKNENDPGPPCNNANKCPLDFKPADANFTATRYMETCTECPNKYPWLGDAKGTGHHSDNYSGDRE